MRACVCGVRPFVQTLFGMLKASNELIEAMLEILQSRRNGSWLQTAMNVIEFQQMLVQAKWIKVRAMACLLACCPDTHQHSSTWGSSRTGPPLQEAAPCADAGSLADCGWCEQEAHDNLYQLPLTDHEVGHIIKGKGKQSVRSIADYLRLPDDQKKGLADLSDKDKEDVLRVCRMMPRLEVSEQSSRRPSTAGALSRCLSCLCVWRCARVVAGEERGAGGGRGGDRRGRPHHGAGHGHADQPGGGREGGRRARAPLPWAEAGGLVVHHGHRDQVHHHHGEGARHSLTPSRAYILTLTVVWQQLVCGSHTFRGAAAAY